MKLILAIVNSEDAGTLTEHLTEAGFSATRVASTGGFLRQGNTTFLVGVDDTRVDAALDVIRKACHTRTRYINPLPSMAVGEEFLIAQPMEVQVGGAIVFVLSVDRFERF